ncbi:hypothetical protein ACE1YR_22700, partial [Pseudomonas sp. K1(2024)]
EICIAGIGAAAQPIAAQGRSHKNPCKALFSGVTRTLWESNPCIPLLERMKTGKAPAAVKSKK